MAELNTRAFCDEFKKVFTHPNGFLVMNAKNLIELNGIPCEIRNEFASGATGELSFVDAWPELWVQDWYEARALNVIDSLDMDITSGTWSCCGCREENEASFDCCWKCLQDRADD